MELRVTCGASDRSSRSSGVWRGITEEGPVWVVEVTRTEMPDWFAMWYFPTKAQAEANRERAIGHDSYGGVVTDARVTEGRAYWSDIDRRPKRSRARSTAHTSLEAMGF